MAELTQQRSARNHAGGKVRAKKRSTKTDMTPMVDLAFLLLTFFLLTTTFKDMYVLRLNMPEPVDDPKDLALLNAENAFSLVLAENDKLYWWIGHDPSAEVTNYSKDGIRRILLEKKESNPLLMVLIKPSDESRFENMVDILDEMEITHMTRYAIVDFTDDDRDRLP